jgi:hypothetical protein
MHDGVEGVDRVLPRECALARRHFEQHRAKREEVGAPVNGSAADLLGCQVPGGPEEDARECGQSIGRRVLRELRDPEIKNLDDARAGEKDVVRLQITMNETGRVRDDQTACDIACDGPRFFCGEMSPSESRAQGLAVEKLGHQIWPPVEYADVENLDDIRMVERRGDASLLEKSPHALMVVRTGMSEHLQRDIAVQPKIGRAIDVTHPTARQQADDAIGPDEGVGAERSLVCEIARRERERRRLEKSRHPVARLGERRRLGGEIRMAGRKCLVQSSAFARITGKPGVMPFRQQLPAVGAHERLRAVSSWRSHARAVFQSLITVRTETPSASAVSSTLKPPKKRSSTT